MPVCDALRRSPLPPESASRPRPNHRTSGHNPHGPDSIRSKRDTQPRKARALFARRQEKSSAIRAIANSAVFLVWSRSQNFPSWSLAHLCPFVSSFLILRRSYNQGQRAFISSVDADCCRDEENAAPFFSAKHAQKICQSWF